MATKRLWTRTLVVTGVAASILAMLVGSDQLAARPLGNTEWRTHSGPLGVTIDVPRSWSISSDSAAAALEVSGHHGERLLFAPLGRTPRDAEADRLLSAATELWPAAEWVAAERSNGGWLVRGETQSLRGTASLLRLRTNRGEVAYVVLAIAPVGRSRMAEQRFAQMIASLRR